MPLLRKTVAGHPLQLEEGRHYVACRSPYPMEDGKYRVHIERSAEGGHTSVLELGPMDKASADGFIRAFNRNPWRGRVWR